MRISDATIEEILKSGGKVSEEQLAKLKKEQETTHHPLQDLVLQQQVLNDAELIKQFAQYAGFEFVDLDPKEISSEALNLIPERIAKQYNAVVFDVVDGKRKLAMEDPDDVQAVDFLKKQLGNEVDIFITTHDNILRALDNYRGDVAEELSDVIAEQSEDENAKEENVSASDIAEDSPISQTVNLLLEYAIRASASDIHIEPREEFIQIRYRIDGVLQEANRLPRNVAGALVSRIKILANLKIDERRVPQDGRFKITIMGRTYALRVSSLPVADGEKVVMRILDEGNHALTLQQLGYWGHSLGAIEKAILQPHGVVLVTGPTGSGKSTSLLSLLSILNSSAVNISTVEDPVEYKIPGVNQTQVNVKAGMTFASGLRALLRQDPNIIMVGEIRDTETADLAVQAALTGHLVFSTLHTNNAATTLPRLLEMGIEPFLIASTARAIIGQRLVRKLCTNCRVAYEPNADEMKEISEAFGLGTPEAIARIHELEKKAASQHIGDSIGADLGSTETTIKRLYKAGENGCDNCNKTGYKGRMGIYEVLDNTTAIQKMIVANATSNDLQEQAIKEGMDTMQVDGLVKALRGETSIEETLRVTRE
ncbi:MAG: GspE/PulE family protein [Candidatus Saccharibacteria bacterium]|nr:GspE/PulE family protein [Candidatus Saccharibacteria bacterium]